MAELMEMVQNDADSSRPASPRAIQSALAIANPEKVAKPLSPSLPLHSLSLPRRERIKEVQHWGVSCEFLSVLPSAFSSDAGYADLPLTLLGAPVDIGALLKPESRSPGAEPQDRDWSGHPPGTGPHVPFRHNRGSVAIHPSRSRD